MNREELKAAYVFGRDVLKEYIERKEQIPAWAIERLLQITDELIEEQEEK